MSQIPDGGLEAVAGQGILAYVQGSGLYQLGEVDMAICLKVKAFAPDPVDMTICLKVEAFAPGPVDMATCLKVVAFASDPIHMATCSKVKASASDPVDSRTSRSHCSIVHSWACISSVIESPISLFSFFLILCFRNLCKHLLLFNVSLCNFILLFQPMRRFRGRTVDGSIPTSPFRLLSLPLLSGHSAHTEF